MYKLTFHHRPLSSAKRSKREFRSTHRSLLMIGYRATRFFLLERLGGADIYMHKSIYGPASLVTFVRSRVHLVTPRASVMKTSTRHPHRIDRIYRTVPRGNEIMRCRFYSSLLVDQDSRSSRCATSFVPRYREKVLFDRAIGTNRVQSIFASR